MLSRVGARTDRHQKKSALAMIDLHASAILSDDGPQPPADVREIARGTVEALISSALAFPTDRFRNLSIFVLPDGPHVGSSEIGEMAAAYAISPT